MLVLPTKKTQALLAYLALPIGQAHPRESLARLFWSEMEETQARGNLRHTLSRIKRAVPSAARPGLLFDGPMVSLDPATIDVDVAQFERLVAEGSANALEQVADVYQGDFLAGMILNERPFEQWLTAERARLHDLAIKAFTRLMGLKEKAGNAEAAIHTGLRILALDPPQESVHRAVMHLYARLGRRAAALRQYQLCVQTLQRELSAAPEAETRVLHEQILRSDRGHADIEVSGANQPSDLPSRERETATAATPPTNIPFATGELIGRAAAIADVEALLAVHRLVTLIGAGGIGKTQLAFEIARRLLPHFPDGVWLAELAPLHDPALVPVTVALALRLTLPAGIGSDRVAAALDARRVLLVLDNCEHVIDAAASMADALTRANPNVRVLATSSEPLRLVGERVYSVSPLDVPSDDAEHDEDFLRAPAVKLFKARAEAAGFHVTAGSRTAALMGAVCRRLDGIPLAIELAAARTATLGVEEVAARLDDRFRLLTGGHRTALPRHQTLRATLDWNYDLLSRMERTLLRCLAIFGGPFGLEAAVAVATSPAIDAADVVDSLASLVEKSLVLVATTTASTRYRLLETTRIYALEKLTENGEVDQIARRHAEYYRDLFERAEIELDAQPAAEWLGLYGGQIDNARKALDWAFSPTGDAALGATLVAATVPLWVHLSLMTECRARVERALASLGQIAPDVRRDMRLLLALGTALWHTRGIGDPEIFTPLTKALELAERSRDTEYRLRATFALYVYRFIMGDYRAALPLAEQMVGIAEEAGRATDAMIAGRLIGAILHILGDQASARRRIEPMVSVDFASTRRAQIVRYQYDQRVVTHSYHARILWLQGFPDQALQFAERIVDYARAQDHLTSLLFGLIEAACPIALYTGDLSGADRFVTLIRDLSVRHGLEAWNVWAECFDSVALIKRGHSIAGSQRLRAALSGLPEIAFHFHHSAFLAELADGLGGAQQPAEGLVIIDEAVERAERKQERWVLAELLRNKGELLLLDGRDTEAEDQFLRALDWARRQRAMSWELRSATSLARLWHQQHRTDDARNVLSHVYDRFTEGFNSADVRAAKTLLSSLSRGKK